MALERDVLRTALRFYRALDTPRSLTCEILARYGEWDQLVSLRLDPAQYREDVLCSSLDQFRRDYAATSLLRKCADLELGVDLEKEAVRTFFLCEAQNRGQNAFLRDWFSLSGEVITTPQGAPESIKLLRKILSKARKWITSTLGGLPNNLNGRFGPGATFESKLFARKTVGLGLTAYDKLQFHPTASSNFPAALEDHVVWSTALKDVWGPVLTNRVIPRVRGNRFASVPKDATKNRGICTEPGLNVWAQLALGECMKQRLLRRGLDLEEGQDFHRRMAKEASRDGHHATLDLSNASDTICKELVRLLLPSDWYGVLDDLRSPETMIQGRWVVLEKFSSMGNGCTFELETLVFASLAHAMGGRVGFDSWVYGDDMIVPSRLAASLVKLLQLSGFTINQKKSYLDGSFRESCGGDYLNGADVRPYFLENAPHDAATRFSFHNGIIDLATKFNMPELVAVARSTIDSIPLPMRVFGPAELGDIVLHSDDLNTWSLRVFESIRYVRALVPVPVRKSLRRYPGRVALGAAILGLPSFGLSPKDCVGGHKVRWLAYS